MKAKNIIKALAYASGFREEEIMGKCKCRTLSAVRHVCMATIRKELGYSHHEIGNLFNCDHTNSVYAFSKYTQGKLDSTLSALGLPRTRHKQFKSYRHPRPLSAVN